MFDFAHMHLLPLSRLLTMFAGLTNCATALVKLHHESSLISSLSITKLWMTPLSLLCGAALLAGEWKDRV